jgi:Zn finger protein HypA/HybF involved in hydrogenase expression
MDDGQSLQPFKAAFEAIRDKAIDALLKIEGLEERSMRWQCKDCHYIKHFTRAVPVESAGKCPRCKSISFEALL